MTEDKRNKQGVALLVAGAVVAAAIGLFWITSHGRGTSNASDDPTTTFEQPLSWDGARRHGDRLTLYFTGAAPFEADDPCSRAYTAVAEAADDAMVVTLRPVAGLPLTPGQGCEDIGYDRSVTVDLPASLQGRPVVDGASGQQRAISGAADLLAPSWLPAGYRFSWEHVLSEIDTYVDTREWALGGHPGERLLVQQGGVDEVGRPGFDPVVLDRPTVRGMPAMVWKTKGFDDLVCVSWAEGVTGYRVCSSGTPGELLPSDVLIRVADGLRNHDGS